MTEIFEVLVPSQANVPCVQRYRFIVIYSGSERLVVVVVVVVGDEDSTSTLTIIN
jgi:hypothetical protein